MSLSPGLIHMRYRTVSGPVDFNREFAVLLQKKDFWGLLGPAGAFYRRLRIVLRQVEVKLQRFQHHGEAAAATCQSIASGGGVVVRDQAFHQTGDLKVLQCQGQGPSRQTGQ